LSSSTPGFWDRGGFWKSVLLGVAYAAIIFGAGQLVLALFRDGINLDDVFGDAQSVLLGLGLPIALGGLAFVLFAAGIGWLRTLFARQPELKRSWWMWILPIAVLAFNCLRFAATDYSQYDFSVVLSIIGVGLIVGFAEELVTRGFAVNLLRRAGYKEFAVATLSSLVFASTHLSNIAAMEASTVLLTFVYTFFFGIAMYFTLRVTRNLIWPMLLHATTDPSLMLLTGGIDTEVDTANQFGLVLIAGVANIVVILLAVVLMWFIRGQVDRYKAYGLEEPAAPVQGAVAS